MNHSWKGSQRSPGMVLLLIGWSTFFIGFHDFTCACVHFLGFCSFIVLSHFSLQAGGGEGGRSRKGHLKQGHQVHRTIGNFENEQSEGRSPDWNQAQITLKDIPIGGVQDAAYQTIGCSDIELSCHLCSIGIYHTGHECQL